MRTPAGRTGRPERVARVVSLAVAGGLVVGCSAGPDVDRPDAVVPAPAAATTGPTSAGSVDLTAEMVQYRRDAQRDVVQVKVTNHGRDAVHVGRVEVRSPTFAAPAAADKDSTVGAGLSVDLPVPLAEPACPEGLDGAPASGAEASGAEATGAGTTGARHVALLVVDGTTVELSVDDDVLEQVRTQRCAEAAVAELVASTWRPRWDDAGERDGEPALRGRLTLTPTSEAPLTVRVEGATTLFTVDEAVEVSLRGTPEVLDVVVTVTRCDPHAVAEDKKGYLFPVRVTPDGGDEVLVEVAVPVPERAPLQELIERTCY